MEFSEYRQPWETGPHWELKREFLEYYKHKFPVDRLLCLAQAYSNIELLQCSYPNQVMLQIHELSKPLKGCKRFRKNGSAQTNNQNSQKQQGKRKINEPASFQKFKFIKFCAGSEDLPNQEASKPCSESSIFSSPSFESISKSENFLVFKKLSEEVKKMLRISKGSAYDIILSAALSSNIEDSVDLKFANRIIPGTISSSEKHFCECFIGTTKISVGEGDTRYTASIKASENALHLLTNFEESSRSSETLMVKQTDESIASPLRIHANFSNNATVSSQTDSNVPQNACENDILKGLAADIQKSLKTRKLPLEDYVSTIQESANRLKIVDDIVYKFSTDSNNPAKNENLFLCELLFKNTLIGQGKKGRKKLAKKEAAETGYIYLMKLIQNCPTEPSSGGKISNSNHQGFEKNDTLKEEAQNNTNESPSMYYKNASQEVTPIQNETIKKPFLLNKALLNNSFKLQLAIFDNSGTLASAEVSATAILSFSAQMCRKNYSYNFFNEDHGFSRAEVLFNQEVVGTGIGENKLAAKAIAAKNALDKLKKQVYTVKVKPGLEEGFHVNRCDMLELKCDSFEAVSNDNIGCRMLKMMGWSGGGIGKKQGIVEPISAGSHNYGAGLGYADSSGKMDMKNLKSRIETLLEGYSKSDAVTPLIFSNDFTKFERKEIHRIAQKFNLFNNSTGKGEARQLIIKRKLSVSEILDSIVRAGGCTKKYELIDLSAS